MSFFDRVLQTPSYGWKNGNDELAVPSVKQLVSELMSRMNFFRTKKNWSAAIGWIWVACLIPFMVLFFTQFFNWWLLIPMMLYGMVVMSSHGNIWYHRYCTHRAYTFSNRFWKFVTANLVIKVVPEEIYVVSHHVHHAKPDVPGDPYNATAGFWYCFLADTNHQPIAKDLDEHDYLRATKLLNHTGMRMNSYAQYLRWGSITSPWFLLMHWVLNWAFWFTALTLIGGPGLACAIFSGALLWALAIRTFNYQGHGKGKDRRREGIDFNRKDLSINKRRPGWLGGEWHNNHHLYPSSARTGYLPYQVDLVWIYIYVLHKIGAVSSYHNFRKQFLRDHYLPSKGNRD